MKMAEEPKQEKTDLADIVSKSLGFAYLGAWIAGNAFGLNYLIEKYSGKEEQTLILATATMLSVAAYFAIPAGTFYTLEKITDLIKRYKTTKQNN